MQGAISLQQKMGRIAPYTQRYSAPQRLHPPVACGDSPPWQGGARGLSGPANKVRNDTFSNKTIGLSIPFSKRKVRQTDFLLIQANIAQPCEQRRASCLPLLRGGGRAKRGRKGGYVAESDIVTTRGRTYCSLYAAIFHSSTSPPPSHGFAVPEESMCAVAPWI